jgi:hypothetical protein
VELVRCDSARVISSSVSGLLPAVPLRVSVSLRLRVDWFVCIGANFSLSGLDEGIDAVSEVDLDSAGERRCCSAGEFVSGPPVEESFSMTASGSGMQTVKFNAKT